MPQKMDASHHYQYCTPLTQLILKMKMFNSDSPIVHVDHQTLQPCNCVPIIVMITLNVPTTVSVIGLVKNLLKPTLLVMNLVVVLLEKVFQSYMNLIVHYKDVNLNSNVTPTGNSVSIMEPSLILKQNNGMIADVDTMAKQTYTIDFIATNNVMTKPPVTIYPLSDGVPGYNLDPFDSMELIIKTHIY